MCSLLATSWLCKHIPLCQSHWVKSWALNQCHLPDYLISPFFWLHFLPRQVSRITWQVRHSCLDFPALPTRIWVGTLSSPGFGVPTCGTITLTTEGTDIRTTAELVIRHMAAFPLRRKCVLWRLSKAFIPLCSALIFWVCMGHLSPQKRCPRIETEGLTLAC